MNQSRGRRYPIDSAGAERKGNGKGPQFTRRAAAAEERLYQKPDNIVAMCTHEIGNEAMDIGSVTELCSIQETRC
jgi:hypothetical protein